MNKQSRKLLFLLLLISCMCPLLCACGGDDGYYYKEEEIIAFVQEHEEEIREQVEAAGEDEKIKEFDGIEYVSDRRSSSGLVYYEYIASGLMTSSLQAGFYYSIDDTPSFNGGASWAGGYGWSVVSTGEENLWQCQEDEGDNYYITGKYTTISTMSLPGIRRIPIFSERGG